uniref:CHR1541 n=1 Tax=Arundo donax TaxID=35708 RepID=A0A0A9UMD6_ARUDO
MVGLGTSYPTSTSSGLRSMDGTPLSSSSSSSSGGHGSRSAPLLDTWKGKQIATEEAPRHRLGQRPRPGGLADARRPVEQRSPSSGFMADARRAVEQRSPSRGFMADARRSQTSDDYHGRCMNKRIYMSNLPPDTRVEELQVLLGDLYERVGKVQTKNCNDDSGESRGEAWIAFEEPNAAHTAVGFLNNCDFKGYKINVVMEKRPAPEALTHDRVRDERVDDFTMYPLGSAVKKAYIMPKEIYCALKPYQKDSLRWFWNIHCTGKGGLLADDMGLGKTRQVLAFVAGLLSSGLIKRALVVVPGNVVEQWVKELSHVGLQEKKYVYRDPKTRSLELQNVKKRGGVLITTHDLARMYWEKLKISWDYLILDEAHA